VAYLLLVVLQLCGLLLIPFGLPGLWVEVAALIGYGWLTDFTTVGVVVVSVVLGLAVLAELAELVLGGRFARRFGGGRRAGWGAILGGMIGAVVGLPIPVLGSIFGAMIGSFAGAFLLELTRRRGTAPALRVGWGALLGWITAIALKVGVGVVILVFTLLTALR
jgi:uncharacterized protein YqgC (DUF456 family)